MAKPHELEICAETLQACHAAEEGGANRMELCSALGQGGVTPSRGLIRAAIGGCRLPVHVLLRPRTGNFLYSAEEFAVLCDDLRDALEMGAAGVVVGVLTARHEVDRERTATLVRLAGGAPVTFHRALDRTRDLLAALDAAIELGCSRVLTSGGQPTAVEGAGMLREMVERAQGQICIAAGGGVSAKSAPLLRAIPGLDFHASLRQPAESSSAAVDPLWIDDSSGSAVSVKDVRGLRRALGLG